MRGDGSLFKRGDVWYMQYRKEGRTIRVSCGRVSKEIAREMLRTATGRLSAGELARKTFQIAAKISGDRFAGDPLVSDLVDDLERWYRTDRQKPAFAKNCRHVYDNHLKAVFGDWRASRVTADELRRYREARLAAGAANATVNRELQVLRKAFNLAAKAEPPKVERIPVFTLPTERNARKGYATPEQLVRLRDAASEEGLWFRALFDLAISLGWRRSELLGLRVGDVDLADKTIRLHTSKNGEPRECPISDDLAILLQQLVVGRVPHDPLFVRASDFQFAWQRVRSAAGCPKLLFHDLRRTSARLKRAAGVDTSVIMRMMGWKKVEMFDRYNIVNHQDKREAIRAQAEYELKALSSAPQIH